MTANDMPEATAAPSLYEHDFYAWLQQQAALARAGHGTALDLSNLAEELESMGRSERRALDSRLQVLLMHLLKWRYQPERRSASWETTMNHQRDGLQDLLDDSPSLRPVLDDALIKAYRRARRDAARETGLAITRFPATCPFTLEQVLDEDYRPE